ncbi:hypothetical protein RRG08_053417 [Elysia crispata]|uniref:Alpha-mannosidase n=1 Tax=Elysia crispata TaxID=231223 RepID=A0AAE0ZFL5_9GAST|nr:hypothetical protein RRG08_053417 [Elysia crispata]
MAAPALKTLLLLGFCQFWLHGADAICGYESCNKEKPGMLNVHLVAHTHNDPGWLVTVDQYYYRQVQFILDTVIKELEDDPNKRFTYVEMAFFTRWWKQQDKAMKDRVRGLVNQGRLEFTLGGWVMNDEAATHYSAIIDQHKLGFEFLRHNFGLCGRTKIGWQIDPFGHSREQASLTAQFGFDGLFFGRLDSQDKEKRQKTQTMEMVWQGSPQNLGSSSDLFTGVLPNGYDYPSGFHFDVWNIYQQNNNQRFIHDDPSLQDYNVDEMVDKFIVAMKEYQSWYGTNHVIATMGSDFNYVDAHLNLKNIDKLIRHVNARQKSGSKINLLYSTPSCYLKSVHDDNKNWTTKSDDFFPYANRPHTYWSGYFTSRPGQKRYTRQLNGFLQSAKQLATLGHVDNSKGGLDNIQKLAASVALGQHHDAVTGTEKQVVAYDYIQRMSKGWAAAQETVNEAYSNLMSKGKERSVHQVFCDYRNVSLCSVTQLAKNFEVTMFNPLTRAVTYTARVPVDGDQYNVLKEDGHTMVHSDLFTVMAAPSGIRPKGRKPAARELVFNALLPPLGYATYFVRAETLLRWRPNPRNERDERTIRGKYVEVDFDSNGYVRRLTNLVTNVSVPLTQNLFYYKAYAGNNTRPEFQSSGAYIFRPRDNTPVKIKITKWEGIVKGSAVQEARQRFSDWASQVVRVYKDKPYVEFEWTVGPIPAEGGGKEIITRYNIPGWGNKGVFHTDSNGREILQRQLNYRPTWQAKIDEPVAGNYFPVDSHINIKSGDSKYQLTVLVDRAEGGSSLNDGDVELMLHRRLLVDDYFGVGQALNEPGLDGKGLIVRGSHYVLLDTVENAARQFRPLAQEIFLSGQPSFSESQLAPQEYVQKVNTKYSGLLERLPEQVHLLTLEQFLVDGPVASPGGTTPYLVRFEHIYEAKEDARLSVPVTFDIEHLFEGLFFVDATELVLGANAALTDIHRLQWNKRDSSHATPTQMPTALNGRKVTLKPMQIVTLQVNFEVL